MKLSVQIEADHRRAFATTEHYIRELVTNLNSDADRAGDFKIDVYEWDDETEEEHLIWHAGVAFHRHDEREEGAAE